MRRLLIAFVILGYLSFGYAQGSQGRVVLNGNIKIVGTSHTASLSWQASGGASSYNIYRSASRGGPYTKLASNINGTSYNDNRVTHSQTLYYVVTAISGTNATEGME